MDQEQRLLGSTGHPLLAITSLAAKELMSIRTGIGEGLVAASPNGVGMHKYSVWIRGAPELLKSYKGTTQNEPVYCMNFCLSRSSRKPFHDCSVQYEA